MWLMRTELRVEFINFHLYLVIRPDNVYKSSPITEAERDSGRVYGGGQAIDRIDYKANDTNERCRI